MSIENNTAPDKQQVTGLKPTSPDEIQHAQESESTGTKLYKINNILGPFEFPDVQDHTYTKSLQQLDQDQLSIVQALDKTAFVELLNKPQAEISAFLIQESIKR